MSQSYSFSELFRRSEISTACEIKSLATRLSVNRTINSLVSGKMELDMFCSLFHAICHLRRGLKFRSPHFSEWKMKKFVCCWENTRRAEWKWWKCSRRRATLLRKMRAAAKWTRQPQFTVKYLITSSRLLGWFAMCLSCQEESESVKSLNITTLTQFISIITPDSSRTICEFKVNRISVRRYCCAMKKLFSPDWGESFSRNLPHFPDTLAQHPPRHSTETSSNFSSFFPVKLGTLVEEHPLWSGSKVILNNSKKLNFPFTTTDSVWIDSQSSVVVVGDVPSNRTKRKFIELMKCDNPA